jgi:hypothetical protein
MRLVSKSKTKIKKYEHSILNNKFSYPDRVYVLYLLLLPSLNWIKPSLEELGLEKDEIDSELFLIVSELFKKYDYNKSSLIPYIEKYLPIYIASRLKYLKRSSFEIVSGLIRKDDLDYIKEEYYLSIPDILFEDKFICKHFTKRQKYLIYKILINDSLSTRELVKLINVSREFLKNDINIIRKILINGGYNVRRKNKGRTI